MSILFTTTVSRICTAELPRIGADVRVAKQAMAMDHVTRWNKHQPAAEVVETS